VNSSILPAAARACDGCQSRQRAIFRLLCFPHAGPGPEFPAGPDSLLGPAAGSFLAVCHPAAVLLDRGAASPWSLPAAGGRAPATSTRPRSPGVGAETPVRAGERWSGRGGSRQTCRLACAESHAGLREI
jgi:hypothetical protein